MNVFEVVKENVTARQAAEAYGLKVGRTGMACCPFHSDKSPSMKLDERYYCFGCGATGDAVDLTAKLFGIGLREAAVKLAEDFGLNYDSRQKPSVRPRIREPTPEQKYQKGENHCYKVLTDYFHLLREWEKKYAPMSRSKKWRLEWAFFLGENGRRQYNHICKKCVHGCKQSFRACLVACPHYSSKRSKICEDKGRKTAE